MEGPSVQLLSLGSLLGLFFFFEVLKLLDIGGSLGIGLCFLGFLLLLEILKDFGFGGPSTEQLACRVERTANCSLDGVAGDDSICVMLNVGSGFFDAAELTTANAAGWGGGNGHCQEKNGKGLHFVML